MINTQWFNNPYVQTFGSILLLIIVVVLAQKLLSMISKRLLSKIISDGGPSAVQYFNNKQFIYWISYALTPLYLYYGVESIPNLDLKITAVTQRILLVILIFIMLRILSSFLKIIDRIYIDLLKHSTKPIKGYLQSLNLIAHLLGVLTAFAILLDKSPWVLLSGLGALTAILLLVFKDSILSLVAGIQITANDLIKVGDWIEMPQFHADGNVIEIALHTVKVQNWDKTITVIPAHQFLENSFKNWRGMQESGGRRIKRSLLIDVKSIRFLDDEDIEKYKKINLLHDYMSSKEKELAISNEKFDENTRSILLNIRQLTNVGTFRNYVSSYLKNNPHIHKDRTFLVRQLAPTPEGLPIEIYVFTNDIRWAYYEEIQSNIFDHLLAIMPEFDLRYFQLPSGHDISQLKFK